MEAQEGIPVQEISTQNKNPLGKNDLVTIILLIFLFPIGVISMWFATKWPKKVKLIITIPVFLAIIGFAIGIFVINQLTKNPSELPVNTPENEQVMCTQEVKLCPDGKTYVGREGPNCEFQVCPTVEPEDASPSAEVKELPNNPTTETNSEEENEVTPSISTESQ